MQHLRMEIHPRTPLMPATISLPVAAAEEAAKYYEPRHRNYHKIHCLYRTMRTFVSFDKQDQKLFLTTLATKLDNRGE